MKNKNSLSKIEIIRKHITKFKFSNGKDLLDIECGAGKEIILNLKEDFKCTCSASNQKFINMLKNNNIDGLDFQYAEKLSLDNLKKYDIILCINDSIRFIKNYIDLEKYFKQLSNHVKKGGIVLIEALYKKKSIPQWHKTNVGVDLWFSSIPNLDYMQKRNLIEEKSEDLEYKVNKYNLGIFEINTTLKMIKNAGFKVKMDYFDSNCFFILTI